MPPASEPRATLAANAVRTVAVLEPRSNLAVLLPSAAVELSRTLPVVALKSTVPLKPVKPPASVRLLLPEAVVATASLTLEPPLIGPLSVMPPAEIVPLDSTAIGLVMPETEPNVALPPARVMLPLPMAATWFTASVPPITFTPSVMVLEPERASVPAPFFVRPPPPEIAPLHVPLKPLVSSVPPPAPRTVATETSGAALNCTVPPFQSNRPWADPARTKAA